MVRFKLLMSFFTDELFGIIPILILITSLTNIQQGFRKKKKIYNKGLERRKKQIYKKLTSEIKERCNWKKNNMEINPLAA